MKLRILSFLLITGLVISNKTFAWSKGGHHIVAEVAFQLLSKSTQQKLLFYLDGMTIQDASTWMDGQRGNPTYNFLTTTHYINAKKGTRFIVPGGKNNLYTELTEVMSELENINLLAPTKIKFDLEILFHLIGDLHQPLHDGYLEDRGGNSIKVSLLGKQMNLHSAYDHGIIDVSKITTDKIMPLYSKYSKSQISSLVNSSLESWINESRTNLDFIYGFKNNTLDQNYISKATPIIESQLLKAGIRLSFLIEKYLGKSNPVPVKEILSTKSTNKQTYTASEATSHIGQTITVCDKVFGTRFLETASGQPTFLNMGAAYPTSPFTVVIFGKDRPDFKEKPEVYFNNKKVCVTGLVKDYRGKSEIVVTKESEIKVVD